MIEKNIQDKDKKIIDELEATNERFRTIFDNAPIGISIWGSTTLKCYESNPANLRLFGRSRDEIMNESWKTFTHPDDVAYNDEMLRKMVKREIDSFTMEKRFYKPDGSIIWVSMTNAFYGYSSDGNHLHICMMIDITERKKLQEELSEMSYQDQLTQIGNRRLFESEFEEMNQEKYLPVSIVIGDVNGLKITNDTFGHSSGDRLLKTVADMISEHFGNIGTVARIGGDEFVAILPKTDAAKASELVADLQQKMSHEKIDETIVCSVSFGIDTRDNASKSIQDTYKTAENKMYQNKLSESEKFREETILAIIKNINSNNPRERKMYKKIAKFYEDKAKL